MRRVALLFALAVTVTGCSEPTTGTPSAGGETSAASGSSTKAPTSSKAPVTRPKQVDLKTLPDTCALITDAMRQQFSLKDVVETPAASAYKDGKRCVAGTNEGSRYVDYTAVRGEGVDKYSSGKGVTSTKVGGFPAYQRGESRNCALAIDIADGQMLMVMTATLDGNVPPDVLCSKVAPFAEAVVTTLVSR